MAALIYFALWAGLIFLMMRAASGANVMGHNHADAGADSKGRLQRSDQVRWVAPQTDVDPVCGKTVHTDRAKSSVHDGMVYYFCSRDCREQFETAPELYLGTKGDTQQKRLDHTRG